MAFAHSALEWLLEKDSPGVRFLALKNLVGLPENNPELKVAKKEAYEKGPIGAVQLKTTTELPKLAGIISIMLIPKKVLFLLISNFVSSLAI